MTGHAGAPLHRFGIKVESDTDPKADVARWVDYDWGDTYEEAARILHHILARTRERGRTPLNIEIIENK